MLVLCLSGGRSWLYFCFFVVTSRPPPPTSSRVLVTTFFSLVTNFFSTFKDIPSHLHLGNGTFAAVIFLFFIIFHVQSSLLLLPLSLLLLLSLWLPVYLSFLPLPSTGPCCIASTLSFPCQAKAHPEQDVSTEASIPHPNFAERPEPITLFSLVSGFSLFSWWWFSFPSSSLCPRGDAHSRSRSLVPCSVGGVQYVSLVPKFGVSFSGFMW